MRVSVREQNHPQRRKRRRPTGNTEDGRRRGENQGSDDEEKGKGKTHLRARDDPAPADEHAQVVHAAAAREPDGPERVQRARHARRVRGEEVERAVPERDVRALRGLEARVHAEAARPRLDRARLGREVRWGREEAPFRLGLGYRLTAQSHNHSSI